MSRAMAAPESQALVDSITSRGMRLDHALLSNALCAACMLGQEAVVRILLGRASDLKFAVSPPLGICCAGCTPKQPQHCRASRSSPSHAPYVVARMSKCLSACPAACQSQGRPGQSVAVEAGCCRRASGHCGGLTLEHLVHLLACFFGMQNRACLFPLSA